MITCNFNSPKKIIYGLIGPMFQGKNCLSKERSGRIYLEGKNCVISSIIGEKVCLATLFPEATGSGGSLS